MDIPVKVLIVEDEPNALIGLAELISGWGYRTETARDGVEGFEKALACFQQAATTEPTP